MIRLSRCFTLVLPLPSPLSAGDGGRQPRLETSSAYYLLQLPDNKAFYINPGMANAWSRAFFKSSLLCRSPQTEDGLSDRSAPWLCQPFPPTGDQQSTQAPFS